MGGNYIFYIKYADEDGNQSDIMCESSIVSIFNGDSPKNIYGTLSNERSSKTIILKIKNLDLAFSKFYLYFSRETSDLNGVSETKVYKIDDPYTIKQNLKITLTGYENISEISNDELNIRYNYYNSAKTQAIIQNMLFLGNVKSSKYDSNKLQQLSYHIGVSLEQTNESIGYISASYDSDYFGKTEYYDVKNIYYKLGY
jgi:hypothetical protein